MQDNQGHKCREITVALKVKHVLMIGIVAFAGNAALGLEPVKVDHQLAANAAAIQMLPVLNELGLSISGVTFDAAGGNATSVVVTGENVVRATSTITKATATIRLLVETTCGRIAASCVKVKEQSIQADKETNTLL